MKPFDRFDHDVATELGGYIANEIGNVTGFFVGDEQCAVDAVTAGFAEEVVVVNLTRTNGERRRYRITTEREA